MRAAGWDGDIVAYLVKDWCFQGAAKSNPAYFVNRVAEARTAALGSTWKTENCEGSEKVIRAVGSNKQEQTIATPLIKRLQCQSSPLPRRSGQSFQPVQLSHRVSGKVF